RRVGALRRPDGGDHADRVAARGARILAHAPPAAAARALALPRRRHVVLLRRAALPAARRGLGDRPTRARWMSAAAGFAGILILVRPGSAVFHPATGLLVLAAVSNALYQLLTRKLQRDTPYTTLF